MGLEELYNKTRCKKHRSRVCCCEPRMTEEEYQRYHDARSRSEETE